MSGTQVVVPFNAAFDADGTANVKQVMQESVAPLAADFEIKISSSLTNDVFKAFNIQEGSADASADIVVGVVAGNASIVKAALSHALRNAVEDGTGKTLKTLLQDYMKNEVETDLQTMGLFNILEAEELINVDISNSVIGTNGSTAMWDDTLATQTASKSNALLNVVATQLPYGQYSDISAGGNLDSAFSTGDSLVFHFTITSKLNVTPVNEDVTGTNSSGIGSAGFSASDAGVAAQAAFDSATHTRTLNVYITKA